MTEPSYRKISNPERFRIGKALEVALVKDEAGDVLKTAEGMVEYPPGWSDARVAAEVIPNYPGSGRNAVANLRTELFGRLRPPAARGVAPADVDSILPRIEAIEAWLRHLGADLSTLPPIN